MDKRSVESLKHFTTQRAMRTALRNARTMTPQPRVAQAPSLTPQQLDRFTQRRIVRDEARRFEMTVVFGKKKKLPMPVFACENDEFDCGEAGHAEGRCGNAQCLGRVKVRLS